MREPQYAGPDRHWGTPFGLGVVQHPQCGWRTRRRFLPARVGVFHVKQAGLASCAVMLALLRSRQAKIAWNSGSRTDFFRALHMKPSSL